MTTNKENVTKLVRRSALPVDGIEPYIPTENEEYMNEAQLEHFRNILQRWKESLIDEVDRTVNHMQSEVKNLSDPSDRATQEEEFALELRTRDRERLLIRKIEKTLNLTETDEYGYCKACGIEIGLQRMEARPTAEFCIDCKTTQEIKEKQLA
ncbi:MAG: C4-type zinc finger protein, DksA/TraR family [uncultured Thiotrichaceae bacterium]|uniref:RNA polymerase-binding transcription factor DksA n=1 Tax=uncultured Thiotrichaceae bacterium TaxID=298394 RepID=A0A6S6UL34_9GAMM|nr:MAG: C4-type zinc finger protein, DksA/TraR family [uncultured Thiotrichaceae bacterium]